MCLLLQDLVQSCLRGVGGWTVDVMELSVMRRQNRAGTGSGSVRAWGKYWGMRRTLDGLGGGDGVGGGDMGEVKCD